MQRRDGRSAIAPRCVTAAFQLDVGISAWIILAVSALLRATDAPTRRAPLDPKSRPQPTPRRPRRGRRYSGRGSPLLVARLAATLVWWTRARAGRARWCSISIDTLARGSVAALRLHARARRRRSTRSRSDAVVFDRAYAHAPQTLPSHASMFTGLLPFEHGVRDNLGFTLAGRQADARVGLLQQAGYRTGGFVSAYVLRSETGIGEGFEVYDASFPRPAADRSPGRDPAGRASRRSRPPRKLARHAGRRALLPVLPHLRAAQALRAAGTVRSLTPYDGEVAYADEIVGKLLAGSVNDAAGTTARRSSSRPITARDSAITASKSTGCSSTTRRSAFRGS